MTTLINRGNGLTASTLLRNRRQRGFSMSELVIVISIMGVMSGIVVPPLVNQLSGGKEILATARQELLNQALHSFAQQNYELLFNPIDGAVADEMVILRTVQYRNPNPDRAMIGSPYVDPRYNPVSSSSTSDFRLRWKGRLYELLKPGQSGTGILMNFDGSDFTTAFDFPPNFQMTGR